MNATQIKSEVKTVTAKELYTLLDNGKESLPFSVVLSSQKYDCVSLSLTGENFKAEFKKDVTRNGKNYAVITPGSKVSYVECSPIASPKKDVTPKNKNKKDKPSEIIPEKVAEVKAEIEPIAPIQPTEVKAEVTPIASPTEVIKETIPDSIVNTQMIDWLEAQGDVTLLAKLCRLQAEFLAKMSQQLNGLTEVKEVTPIATTPKNTAPAVTPTPKNTEVVKTDKPKKSDNSARDRFDAIIQATNFLTSKGNKTTEQDKIDAKEKFYWVEFDPENPKAGMGPFNQYISAMNWTKGMISQFNPTKTYDSARLANLLAEKFTFNEWLEIYTKEKVCKNGTEQEKAQHALAIGKKYYSNFFS